MLDTPVVFLVFNRAEATRRVLAQIRAARPRQLFVVADGPRSDRPDDPDRCEAVRALIEGGIDWPCEVRRDLADQNLGCARRVSSGLDWVFAHVEEAIVLEDDCVPDVTFFPFCAELLARYRDEMCVGQICGSTITAAQLEGEFSYRFSRYGPVWGWASWRRAWKTYDIHMSEWPRLREADWLTSVAQTQREVRMRTRIYDDLRAGRIDTWDYQWGFAKLVHGLLSVIPAVNLIENIGAGPDATHPDPHQRSYKAFPMIWPLRHPLTVLGDENYDRAYSNRLAPSLARRTAHRFKRLFGR
jgi:hypothetical protein